MPMIRELLDLTFMREKVGFLAALAREMQEDLPGSWPADYFDQGPVEIRPEDVSELLESFDTLLREQTFWEPDSGLWLPHFRGAALLQAAMDLFYRRNGAVDPNPGETFGERLNSDPLVREWGKGGKPPFIKSDPRWVVVLKAKWIRWRHGLAEFRDNTSAKEELAEKARIVVMGDWGSGAPDAAKLARNIWKHWLEPEVGKQDLHVVHLGDVYFAGLAHEYLHNLLKPWPVPRGYEKQISSWSLAGNHDMYSGGHAFFDMLKEDERFARQNQSAYFLLENTDWQVFGLDTAFDGRDFKGSIGELYGEQVGWVILQRAAAWSKKCLLFTHHQPFSAYEPTSERLERQLRSEPGKQIEAWFWGHEHRCAVYQPHDKIKFPILLGHGGFPEKAQRPLVGAPSLKYEWLHKGRGGFLRFGFAVLDFDGPSIWVRLVDEDNEVRYTFPIT